MAWQLLFWDNVLQIFARNQKPSQNTGDAKKKKIKDIFS